MTQDFPATSCRKKNGGNTPPYSIALMTIQPAGFTWVHSWRPKPRGTRTSPQFPCDRTALPTQSKYRRLSIRRDDPSHVVGACCQQSLIDAFSRYMSPGIFSCGQVESAISHSSRWHDRGNAGDVYLAALLPSRGPNTCNRMQGKGNTLVSTILKHSRDRGLPRAY